VGAALDGSLRSACCGRPEKRLPPGMAEGRSALGVGQAPDHIEGVIGQLKDFSLCVCGASARELEVGWVAEASSGQDRGLHLRTEQINDSLGRPLRHLADLLV
jgi:hypothetical protein